MRFIIPNKGGMSQDWLQDNQFPGSSSPCAWGANKKQIEELEKVKMSPLGLSEGSE
jgi:hypothetical protein